MINNKIISQASKTNFYGLKKKYTHKRIWQVAMIMKERLEVIKKRFPTSKNINKRYKLSLK